MLRRLNVVFYTVQRGLRGMRQSLLVQLLAVSTMAVCMLLLGVVTLIFQNATGVAQEWGIDVPVTVYMVEGTPEDETEALVEKLQSLPEVVSAERITPHMALERLQDGLGGESSVLDGIDADALPDSVELHLYEGVEPGFGQALATRLQGFENVEEVAVLGPWAQQATDLLDTLRTLAIGVGLLVGLACMAIVWSTIRLGVFARRAEIEILRLVGGTNLFVRGPFLVEGVIQGLAGTSLALLALFYAFEFVRPFLQEGLSLVFAAGSISFFSPLEIVIALSFGALIGVLGARAAVSRYVEA